MSAELRCMRPGLLGYAEARDLQRRLEGERQADEIPDVLILLEHPPVYTKGRRTDPAELGMGEDWYRMQGIEVTETDRGGRVTYHGPGQLVGYPILKLDDLRPAAPGPEAEDVRGNGVGVVDYVRLLERVMIGSLTELEIEAQVIEGLTGVWTAGPPPATEDALADPERAARKIGSIGVHVRRGVTTHGFAINVNNDLQPFEWIVPCGIEGCRMTSVSRELGAEHDFDAFSDLVARRFASVFDRELAEAPSAAPVP